MENTTHSIRAGHKSCSAVMVLISIGDQWLASGFSRGTTIAPFGCVVNRRRVLPDSLM